MYFQMCISLPKEFVNSGQKLLSAMFWGSLWKTLAWKMGGAWRQRSADRFVLLAGARPDIRLGHRRKRQHQAACKLLLDRFIFILKQRTNLHSSHQHFIEKIILSFIVSQPLCVLPPTVWRSMPSEKTFKQRRTFGECRLCWLRFVRVVRFV